MTTTKDIEIEIRNILKKINELGYCAYLVGGAVRDKLLRLPISDYDICTNMPLDQVKELYPRFHIMKPNSNRQVGVLNVLGVQTEIAEFKGNNIIEDIYKRDFTINTFLIDYEGNIYDYLNAHEDLAKKVIKLVNQDGSIFKEDPSRILRAIRLSSKLGFTIDYNCYQHMLDSCHALSKATPEKVYSELKKILTGKYLINIINDIKPFILAIIPELENKDYDMIVYMLKDTPSNYLLILFILFNSLSLEEITSLSIRLKIDKKTINNLSEFIYYKNKLLSLKKSRINDFINKHSIYFITALFTYQERYFKYISSNEQLKQLYKIEKIYYQVLYEKIQKNLHNLHINPSLFSSIQDKKELILIEDDIIQKVISHKLDSTPEEIKKYLLLRT